MRSLRALLLSALLVAVVGATALAALTEEFHPLFDGKSIDGWVRRGGEAEYHVENGEIVGVSKINTQNTFLCTPREYGDFILEVELKVDSGLNSGIQIRSECFDEAKKVTVEGTDGKPREINIPAGRVHGYQVEIDPAPRAFSGGIYDEARRGWLYEPCGAQHAKARAAFKLDDWNKYRIECRGDSIKTWVNGVPVSDLHDSVTAKGFIALQVHSVGGDEKMAGKEVRWRNLNIAELDADDN
ncbi:MAG: hypothetical protein CMJ58_00930 [Planctomycetaceae bacterium]|nr:hypothetical protein [Planctomycetaceae bacterium]